MSKTQIVFEELEMDTLKPYKNTTPKESRRVYTKESYSEFVKRGMKYKVFKDFYKNNKVHHYECLKEILDGLENGIDASIYAKSEFNNLQMEVIRKGLELGLDVSIYAKSIFSFEQMMVIKDGLEHKLNVSFYANPEFDEYQMSEIEKGLLEGIDVSSYAKPNNSAPVMYFARMCLKEK